MNVTRSYFAASFFTSLPIAAGVLSISPTKRTSPLRPPSAIATELRSFEVSRPTKASLRSLMTHPPCLRLCPANPGNPRGRTEGESPLQGKGHTVYDRREATHMWNKYGPTAARRHGKPGREMRPSSTTIDIHSHVAIPDAAALVRPHLDPATIPLAHF